MINIRIIATITPNANSPHIAKAVTVKSFGIYAPLNKKTTEWVGLFYFGVYQSLVMITPRISCLYLPLITADVLTNLIASIEF